MDIDTWTSVKRAFRHTDYLQQRDGIGFKRVWHYIIQLKYETSNINRSHNTVNKSWAKYRSLDAQCVSIWDTRANKFIQEEIMNVFKGNIARYQAGKKVIWEGRASADINDICCPGVHFFTTLEAAFHYDSLYMAVHVGFSDNVVEKLNSDGWSTGFYKHVNRLLLHDVRKSFCNCN